MESQTIILNTSQLPYGRLNEGPRYKKTKVNILFLVLGGGISEKYFIGNSITIFNIPAMQAVELAR